MQFRNYKVIYKRYAGLFFALCVDVTDSELAMLEVQIIYIIQFIHLYVEVLDKYFGSVCELDIVFNFNKVKMPAITQAYAILDEMILGGEVMETSKKVVLESVQKVEVLD